jgi:hypothetical protein
VKKQEWTVEEKRGGGRGEGEQRRAGDSLLLRAGRGSVAANTEGEGLGGSGGLVLGGRGGGDELDGGDSAGLGDGEGSGSAAKADSGWGWAAQAMTDWEAE